MVLAPVMGLAIDVIVRLFSAVVCNVVIYGLFSHRVGTRDNMTIIVYDSIVVTICHRIMWRSAREKFDI